MLRIAQFTLTSVAKMAVLLTATVLYLTYAAVTFVVRLVGYFLYALLLGLLYFGALASGGALRDGFNALLRLLMGERVSAGEVAKAQRALMAARVRARQPRRIRSYNLRTIR